MVAGLVGFLTAVTMAGGSALSASADTASDLQAQINSLLATIQSLQAQLAATTGGSTSAACTFTRDLTIGVTGSDVMCLQKVLNSKGFTVATTGAGSPGNESTYFGAKTQAAVSAWQKSAGISPTAGYFGAKSRAAFAAMGGTSTGTGTGTGTTPMGSGLTINPGVQPMASLAPQGASRVPFTTFTLTASNDGDITVNSIAVQRGGLAQDAVFSGIVLLNSNGIQIGIAKTLNSNHQATVGDPFTIPRGTSQSFTIAGNMNTNLAAYAGQVAALSIVGVNTSATVNGSFPITGAAQTINATLALGAAQMVVSSFDPLGAQTKNIGNTNVIFSGIRITAGSAEALRLWSIRFNQSGSAGANDLANVMVYIDGTAYPTTVSTDGKYYTASFTSGILIDKGLSKDVYIQGDIVGSSVSGRTVQFDIYKNTDVYLSGEIYHYGVTPLPSGNTASAATTGSEFITSDGNAITSSSTNTPGTPLFSASLITVNPGQATSISKATSVISQNIAVNVPNQILGGFTTNFVGEPVSVQSMSFSSTTVGAFSGGITNVSLYNENGAVVAGPVDWTTATLTFTDTVTFPTGSHTYTLKGKIPSGTANNATIVVKTTPSTQWSNVTGQVSGNSITNLPTTQVAMNTMTVKSATLAVSMSATPASMNIVAGGTGVTYANVQLDASQSGEDIRISTIPLRLTSASVIDISACQLYNASNPVNTGSNVPLPPSGAASTTPATIVFHLDSSLTVPKGTIVSLALKCNLVASGVSTYAWSVNSGDTWTATGFTSGNTLSGASTGLVITTGSAGTMAVANGTLAVTLDSSSPSYGVATNGSTGVTVGVLRLTSTNEAINMQKISLQLSPISSSASSTPADLVQVTLWDGATQVGTATFTGSSRNATSTLTSTVTVPKDSYKLITLKADLATLNAFAGIGANAKPGALIKVDYDGQDTTGTQGTGNDSGITLNPPAAASDTAVAGVRVFKSYPIFTYSTTGATAQSGVNDLLVLNVQANSTGDVKLNKIVFSYSTTTATLASPTFSGPNGNVASTTNVNFDVVNNPGTITVYFDSVSNTQDNTVAAGQTKSYTLRGTLTLTGNSGQNGSIGIALKADTAYPSLQVISGSGDPLLGTVATSGIASSKMIWSPNSTTTVTNFNNDWTNGYGLPGCFSSSGLGQDCTQRVLAK